jgi:hypothetical protein
MHASNASPSRSASRASRHGIDIITTLIQAASGPARVQPNAIWRIGRRLDGRSVKVHTSDVERAPGGVIATILIVLLAHVVAKSHGWGPAYYGTAPRSTAHEARQPSDPPVNQLRGTPPPAVIAADGSCQQRNLAHSYAVVPVLMDRNPPGSGTSAEDVDRPLGPSRSRTFPLLI